MKQAIKRAMIALFPELGAGLHLDRYARVVAVADAPGEGAASERFRPRFAVDIQILTPDGEPAPAFPVYTAVPLPVQSGAGQEKGLFSFPEPGAQVVVGFAYGRPDHPIIRQVYPFGVSLPAVAQGEQLWQSTPTTFQRADADGNWSRKTEARIKDESRERIVSAQESTAVIGTETRTVREHSVEAVGGNKQVEAMNLTLIGGARTDLASLGNINTTAGAHMTTTTGKTRTDTTGGDFSEDVGGKRTANVAGSVAETIGKGKSSAITGDEKTDVHGDDRRRENHHGGAGDDQLRLDHWFQGGERVRRDVRFRGVSGLL